MLCQLAGLYTPASIAPSSNALETHVFRHGEAAELDVHHPSGSRTPVVSHPNTRGQPHPPCASASAVQQARSNGARKPNAFGAGTGLLPSSVLGLH
jgi:hypothetical protein